MREVEASHTSVVATVGLTVLLWAKNSGEHSAGSSGVLKGELGACSFGVLKGDMMLSMVLDWQIIIKQKIIQSTI